MKPVSKNQQVLELREQITVIIDQRLDEQMVVMEMTVEEREYYRRRDPFFRRMREEKINKLFHKYKGHI